MSVNSPGTGSKRKPHNGNAGYVCELKSHHPKLPGHFVIYDRDAEPSPMIDSSDRWILMHEPSSYHVTFRTLADARYAMREMAGGSDLCDMGQHDREQQPC